ncbi:MAG: hypothetical protein GX070_11100 [Alcaligenaceae bacterium]|nr:hypothetical protein [Alcaligenaceae bacterium]
MTVAEQLDYVPTPKHDRSVSLTSRSGASLPMRDANHEMSGEPTPHV